MMENELDSRYNLLCYLDRHRFRLDETNRYVVKNGGQYEHEGLGLF